MVSNMQISCPIRTVEIHQAKLTAKVTCGSGTHELTYSIPVEYADWFATDRCDGFVVGLLFQAMERSEDMVLEGPISSRLFHSLQSFFIPLMAQAFLNLHPVKIVPASLTTEQSGGMGVATGFSGGIDSFASVIQHLVGERSPDHRITHFLFHNAGGHGHGKPEDARKLFLQRYNMVQPFTREVGIPLIPVDSNLAEVFPIDFITMHSALNASIPLVLQNQFQRYYYASAYKYADCGVNRTDDIAHFDPFAFHLLSTESLECVSTGCQMSRIEKTALVATYEPSRRYLNVCVDAAFEGRNCSVCFKCCRTILTLELLGVADLYQNVFDLEKFSKVRNRYIVKVLRYKRGSFEAEIAELIRKRGDGFFSGVFRLRHFWDRLANRP
jgi:hypothetical protein